MATRYGLKPIVKCIQKIKSTFFWERGIIYERFYSTSQIWSLESGQSSMALLVKMASCYGGVRCQRGKAETTTNYMDVEDRGQNLEVGSQRSKDRGSLVGAASLP
jgi:hypothetical protein